MVAKKKRIVKEKKPVLKRKTKKVKKTSIELDEIRKEPIVNVKHEMPKKTKIISGVSQSLGDLLGVDVNIVRILFLISFVFIIGIPVYIFLSLVMKD